MDPILTFVGDVMPGRKVGQTIRQVGPKTSAARVRAALGEGVVVANLECPLHDIGPDHAVKPNGGPNLWAPKSMAQWLGQAGISVASLANNHVGDCGPQGVRTTMSALCEAGLAHVGAGEDCDRAITPRVIEIGSHRVALLAFGNGQAATDDEPGVCPFQTDWLQEGLAQVPDDVSATVVMMHNGVEFLPYPESWARDFAAEAIRGGADLVIGGHPHCLRGWAPLDGGTAYYGLGDCVMDTADPQLLADHVKRTAMTVMGFGVGDPLICRWSMALDVKIHRPHRLEFSYRPLIVDQDFLPRSATPDEAAALERRLSHLCTVARGESKLANQLMRPVERAYMRQFGARRLRDWLSMPLRLRPRHFRQIWRRTKERAAG